MISVSVVDRDPALVRSVVALVNASPALALAGTAHTADEALSVCRDERPDVVLVDVNLPGRDGISLTSVLTGGDRWGRPRVLVTVAVAVDDHLVRALGSGASGFVSRRAPWPIVEHAIHVVHEGGIALPGDLTARIIDVLLPGTAHSGNLTEREADVLHLVGAGRSPRQIAGELVMSESTVRSHLDHLRSKLGVRTRVELALAARAAGLGYLVTGATGPTRRPGAAGAGPERPPDPGDA